LAKQRSDLICPACGLKFQIVLGIPDLRHPRPEISKSERIKIDRLVKGYSRLTFQQLLEIFLEGARLSSKIKQNTLNYYAKQAKRSEDMGRMFLDCNEKAFGPFPRNTVLDLGCGAGGGAIALGRSFKHVLAVDSDFGQLILAKKAISLSERQNIRLLCAYAESLPLANALFNYIQCDNVLEHLVDNLSPVIREIHRVLTATGRFSADSRNRFDLFLPEPHSGIRWLGFLPRRWTPWFVRKFTGNHYEQTRLLAYNELRKTIGSVFDDYQITLPQLSAYGRVGVADRRLQRLLDFPFIRRMLMPVFSTHIVVARKRAGKSR
jgi:ubiquinone/menaquinone biosynthesis C-methylase UbiE